MNSKQAFKELKESAQEVCEWELDRLNIIEKDLEILEILKNNLYEEKGTGRFKGCNTINCSLGNQHSGIDYTKVKDWLEND